MVNGTNGEDWVPVHVNGIMVSVISGTVARMLRESS